MREVATLQTVEDAYRYRSGIADQNRHGCADPDGHEGCCIEPTGSASISRWVRPDELGRIDAPAT